MNNVLTPCPKAHRLTVRVRGGDGGGEWAVVVTVVVYCLEVWATTTNDI